MFIKSVLNNQRKLERVLIGLILLSIGLFLINIWGTLRLNTDAVRYFLHMELLFEPNENSILVLDTLPKGYVYFLAFLKILGTLNNKTIILSNLLFFLGGFYGLALLTKKRKEVLLAILLSLSSWVILKHLLLPLSEPLFFFLSVWCLYYIQTGLENKNYWKIFLSIMLLGLAIMVRTIGIILIPTIIWIVLNEKEVKTYVSNLTRRKTIFYLFMLILVVIAFIITNLTSIKRYLNDASTQLGDSIINRLFNNLIIHFSELGEIVLNLPMLRLAQIFPTETFQILLKIGFVSGGVLLLLFASHRFLKKDKQNIIDVYALFYILFIFIWPYYDPRFWVPITPLLIWKVLDGVGGRKIFYSIFSYYYILGLVYQALLIQQSLESDFLISSMNNKTGEAYKAYFLNENYPENAFTREIKGKNYENPDLDFETFRILIDYEK